MILKRPRIEPVNHNILKQVTLICILVVHLGFLVGLASGTFESLLNRYIDDDRQIGPDISYCKFAKLNYFLNRISAAALVSTRGRYKSVTQNGLTVIQGWFDYFRNKLGSRCHEQHNLCLDVHSALGVIFEKTANLVPDFGAPRVVSLNNRYALSLEVCGE